MPYRKIQFAPGEYYHLCVRGNNKQDIFFDDRDRARMMFLITHLQSAQTFPQIHRVVNSYQKTLRFGVDQEILKKIVDERYVVLQAFALMTNHIHIALKEEHEGGVVTYMQRILTAYAKYLNAKYATVGHVLQGPYRSVHVSSNEQLLYLSTYIHRNPRELPGVAGREHEYEWSSFKDYLGENRFGKLLDPSLVLDQFDSPLDYKKFVDESPAKTSHMEFDLYESDTSP